MCVASKIVCIDNICAMVIVWRIRGQLNRTVLCCVVYHSCELKLTSVEFVNLQSTMSHCVTLTTSHCCTVTMSLCRTVSRCVTLSHCVIPCHIVSHWPHHTVALSPCHYIALYHTVSHCRTVSYHVTLCHTDHITVLHCHHVTMSHCVTLSHCVIPCHIVSHWPHHTVALSPCHYVTLYHIVSHCRTVSYHVALCHADHITLLHCHHVTMSHCITQCHNVALCHTMSHCVTPCHIVSHCGDAYCWVRQFRRAPSDAAGVQSVLGELLVAQLQRRRHRRPRPVCCRHGQWEVSWTGPGVGGTHLHFCCLPAFTCCTGNALTLLIG